MFGKKKKVSQVELARRQAQERAAKAKSIQEEQMEKIVILARVVILPLIKEQNKGIEETKIFLDSMAIAIQQGLFELMKTTTVGDLKMAEYLEKSTNEAEKAKWLPMLDALKGRSMADAVEALQWMKEKIDALIKAENKDRSLADLKLDF